MSGRGAPRPAALAATALIAVACGTGGAPPGSSTQPLSVFAAASLVDVIERIETEYGNATGQPIESSTDASSALRAQIEQGAPADLFLSADEAAPQVLVDAGLAESAVPFARNEVVIVVPAGEGPVAEVRDLARPGVRVVAAGESVPITRYAGQLLDRLAALDGMPPDFRAAVAANVVSREDNVRAVLTRIELGEGDAGIVYRSDARSSTDVAVLEMPPSVRVEATYAAAVLTRSPRRAAAQRLLDWILGPDGRAALAGAGFLPP